MKAKGYIYWVGAFYFLLVLSPKTYAQTEYDKCGSIEAARLQEHEDYWGYSFSDLELDLDAWNQSEFVELSSIGQSTLGREIHELTITDTNVSDSLKRRIYIHTRTHPGEVQSFQVVNEIIKYLLDGSEIGNFLRSKCIFHIVPMYNPDGVMLEYPRENANGVDIESNWFASSPEIEVLNLKARFVELMGKSNPIEIALNMHSDNDCLRFFVCHDDNGTSQEYFELEKNFIGGVRNYFSTGISPYYYMITWSSGTPERYPESWWWFNHQEKVMALTYEDMNCSAAGQFDMTAFAILSGISDYLELEEEEIILSTLSAKTTVTAFPNPFINEVTVKWDSELNYENAYLTDMQGRLFEEVSIERVDNGLKIDATNLANGYYIITLETKGKPFYLRLVKGNQ